MIENKAATYRREYLRKWREQNPEKVRQYNRDYWERRAKKEEEKRNAKAATLQP